MNKQDLEAALSKMDEESIQEPFMIRRALHSGHDRCDDVNKRRRRVDEHHGQPGVGVPTFAELAVCQLESSCLLKEEQQKAKRALEDEREDI